VFQIVPFRKVPINSGYTSCFVCPDCLLVQRNILDFISVTLAVQNASLHITKTLLSHLRLMLLTLHKECRYEELCKQFLFFAKMWQSESMRYSNFRINKFLRMNFHSLSNGILVDPISEGKKNTFYT
jgi:hypothetical protein